MKSRHADASSPAPSVRFFSNWWLFCLLLLSLKLFLLALDPVPKLFMGDSGSYLWTAFSGWIPLDRSFLYGYLIRWTSLSAGSLSSLLLLQAFLGFCVAAFVTFICRQFFVLPVSFACAFGLVCAIDPMQLVWERYVMAETSSLFFYAATLVCALYYLEQKRLWQLLLVQILGVLLISLRISYLLVVEATTVLLPLLLFVPLIHDSWRSRSTSPVGPLLQRLALHLVLSSVLFFGLHYTYKSLNGFLAGRPAAYLYTSGFSILAAWAPTLRPQDTNDPRLAQIIRSGDQFRLTDMRRRNNQLYSQDSLIARWKGMEPDLATADAVAKQAALHSLIHRPLGVAGLGVRTFLSYFDFKQIRQQAKSDLGNGDWPNPMMKTIAARLRLSPPDSHAKSFSLLQRYFIKSQPYWYLIILCPLFGVVLVLFIRETSLLLLLAHGCIFLATDCFLAVTASVRYLQPLSLLTMLLLALFVKVFLLRRRLAQQTLIH